MRILALLLAVATLALPGLAQRGPANSPGPAESHSAPLTFDAAGRPDSWFVVAAPADHARLIPEAPLAARLTLPDGQVWTADLTRAAVRTLDSSRHERTTLRWAMFEREGVQSRLGGVHLFTTTRADGLVEYAAIFSNGAVVPGVAGSFCGPFYYDRLELEVQDRNRKLAADLRAGEEQSRDGRTLVFAAGGGQYFPPRAQFTRRFVSYRKAGLLESSRAPAARAVLELSDASLPRSINAWGALKLARRADPASDWMRERTIRLRASLRTGAPDEAVGRFTPACGPFFGLGYPDPGTVGGAGILPVPAPELSVAAARWHRLAGDLVSERMPIVAVHAETGEPLGPAEWAVGGATQWFEYRLTRGWGGVNQIPVFAAREDWSTGQLVYTFADFNQGTCAYRSALLAQLPHDDAHLSRGTKDDQASWLLSHDWAARLRQAFVAHDVETSHTLRGARPLVPEYPGQWLPFSLEASLMRARANPGRGGQILRQLGWAMDAVAGYAVTLSPGPERAEHVEWARAMLDLSRLTVMPSGIAYDGRLEGNSDNRQPWAPLELDGGGLPTNVGSVPQFQLAIYHTGLVELGLLVGLDDPAVRETLAKTVVRACENQYLGGLALVPSKYGGNAVGPPWYLVVSENGVPVERLTRGGGLSQWIHSWHDCALAYRVSSDRRFLDAMLRVGPPTNTLEARLAGFAAQRFDREWTVLPEAALREHLR